MVKLKVEKGQLICEAHGIVGPNCSKVLDAVAQAVKGDVVQRNPKEEMYAGASQQAQQPANQ